ncbi:MAG: hypothetical protein JXQ83_00025, partial [Candidatus Glassbacteria bacterium]|nr:hypothetical protein [Candidatus Glassbacteria bacterium]
TEGLVQTLDPGDNPVLAGFGDGRPALVLVSRGRGKLYCLASPPTAEGCRRLLCALAADLDLNRPVLAVDSTGSLVAGAEVRSVERDDHLLVYACNLGEQPVEFELQSEYELGPVEDLRRLKTLAGLRVSLAPYEETVFRVGKAGGR